MLSSRYQNRSQVDDVVAVQVQPGDGCSARGREADQQPRISTPLKMLAPLVAARVVEQCQISGLRVNGLCRRKLAAVAALTGPCQITQVAYPIKNDRNSMLGGEIVRRVVGGRRAVFAPAASSALDHAPDADVNQGGYSTGIGRRPSCWVSASRDTCRSSANLTR